MSTRRPMPPPLEMPKPGFGRRTPPALFPPIMGLFGVGLGWRAASEAFGIAPAIADLILGATSVLFLFTLAAYLAKPLRRPAAFMEDLRVLPGRAGLSAASLCVMLFAAVVAPYASGLATGLALLAFGIHVALVVAIVMTLIGGPEEGRVVTPVFHLSFVGFIIGGVAANALGHPEIARWLLWSMLVPAGLIWGFSARQLLTRVPPAPLRPLLAIHLAPASLFTIVAAGAGLTRTGLCVQRVGGRDPCGPAGRGQMAYGCGVLSALGGVHLSAGRVRRSTCDLVAGARGAGHRGRRGAGCRHPDRARYCTAHFQAVAGRKTGGKDQRCRGLGLLFSPKA
ncbi:hypothetical protein ROE7235_01297 [Roseibaca ekhonensis]|uniref:Tellurite resistance protein TehA n=1 Tax=Roseinatronobacter ekhonensis TaxID=254356 RepID=A0A3B0MCX6_9RHOB|nr:tellurium resistance protein [Roseibaca ekhonensis]SUZ31548.1 hypothetical protein ROE7235_01297 [Roseibaca ekhonensis]